MRGNRSVICNDALGSTSSTFGPPNHKEQEGNADSGESCKHEDHDNVHQDLDSQVFVDFEVFLQSALHVPRDWRILWVPAIEAIKADQEFSTHHGEYCRRCEEDPLGQSFSDLLIKTTNSIIDVMSTSKFNGISGNPHVNSPRRLLGSAIDGANFSPTLAVPHKDRRPLHRANDIHVLKEKWYNGVICNGKQMARLIVDGKHVSNTFHGRPWLTRETGIDPIWNHAPPHDLVGSKPREPASPSSSTTGSEPPLSRKRRWEGSLEGSQRASKKPRTKLILFRPDEKDPPLFRAAEESESPSALIPGAETQSGPGIQIWGYLLEMFSNSLLRSHATVCLVDRDRLQLYHANRSVILVSSAINFSRGYGLDHFITVVIALYCLSLKENGALGAFPMDNIRLVTKSNLSSDDEAVQSPNQLELTEDGSNRKFTVTLGNVISHDSAIIGRSTLVLKAGSERWPNTNLVVKVSWPKVGWGAESEFLEKAIEEAKKTEGGWATKHLPQMFWAKDIVFGEDSTLGSVANLFKDAEFSGRNYTYERRVLRIIIQEELYPLKSLTNMKDIGQVFVDIACSACPFCFLIPLHLHNSSSSLAL